MINVIAVTSISEQQDAMQNLRTALKSIYHTDLSIEILQQGISRVDVYHTVNEVKHLAKSYRIVIVPVMVNFERVKGFPLEANINVDAVLERLDECKREVIAFVNKQRVNDHVARKQKKDLEAAVKNLFT
jgi:hypothetical protein